MRLHRLDLNLLVALDALLIETNVTRAARRMNMSQTTMSGALARLREHFADELLVQRGRQLVLTPLAESLKMPVRSIVTQAETVALRHTAFDPATAEGRFTLIALDAVHAVFTHAVSQRLLKDAPGLTLVLESFARLDDVARLDSSDVQFMVMPKFDAHVDHPMVELFEEQLVCIADAAHPLARRKLTLEGYLAATHILPEPNRNQGFDTSDALALRYLGHRRRAGIVTTSYVLMPTLVLGTPHLATVPRRLANWAAQRLPIKIWDLPYSTPRITEVLQWHRAMDHDPALVWLRQLMLQVAREI